jgi:hypothetical protein
MTIEPELPLETGPDSSEAADAPARGARHLATFSHDGRFWDVYVEFDDDPTRVDSFGGLLCFSPADAGTSARNGPVRTATILIEPSYEEVLHRARQFENHHLVSLLRSCLPDPDPDADGSGLPDPAP